MSSWPGEIFAITLFVENLHASKRFYAEAFGQSPVFEDETSVAYKFGNTIVNLLVRSATPELLEPAIAAPLEAGTRLLLTIQVDDVDATCAMLAMRGVELLNGPIDRPWGIRTASFQDLDGHVWEIAK